MGWSSRRPGFHLPDYAVKNGLTSGWPGSISFPGLRRIRFADLAVDLVRNGISNTSINGLVTLARNGISNISINGLVTDSRKRPF